MDEIAAVGDQQHVPPNGVAWAMELKGHQFDLEELEHLTADNPIRVTKSGERYDLVMPFDVVGVYHKEVRRRAEVHVMTLNGIGAVFGSAYVGVELTGVMYTIDETGQRRDVVVQAHGAPMRTKFGRASLTVGGQPETDPTRGLAAQFVAVAEGSTAVRDALQIVGRPVPSWSELYVAFELVEANGGGGRMVNAGWIDEDDLELFRHTVNNYNALGIQARHAKMEWAAPADPMTHLQAVALIRQVVGAWLKDLAGRP